MYKIMYIVYVLYTYMYVQITTFSHSLAQIFSINNLVGGGGMMKVVFYGAVLKHPRNHLEVQALGLLLILYRVYLRLL